MNQKKLSHKIIRSVSWNLFGQGWLILLSFVSIPYIVHRLNVQLYGIYTLVGVIIGYLAFLNLGLIPALIKFASRCLSLDDNNKVRGAFWSCMFVYLAAGLLITAAIYGASRIIIVRFFKITPDLIPTALFALRLGALGFLFSALTGVMIGMLRAIGRFDLLNRLLVASGTLQIVGAIVLLMAGYSLNAIVLFNVVLQAATFLVYWYKTVKLLPFLSHPAWEPSILLQLLKDGAFIGISSVTEPVIMNIEKVFLTSLRSIGSLTYYAIPFTMVSRLSIIPSSVLTVLFPIFSRCQNKENEQLNKELYFRSTLYMLFIYGFLMVFFITFGKQFMFLWMGSDFAEKTSTILSILFIAGFINTASLSSTSILMGMGKAHIPAILNIAETLFYVPTSYYLIYHFGTRGAAIAWSLCMLVNTLLLTAAASRMLGINLVSFYGRLTYFLAPPLAICLSAFWYLWHFHLSLLDPRNLCGIALVALLYFLTVWKWGLDDIARVRARQCFFTWTGETNG